MHFTYIDYIITAAFFAALILIPAIASRKAKGKGAGEYFKSEGSMPWWLIGVSMVAATTSTNSANLFTEIIRRDGLSGNWVWWAFLLTGMLTVFVYSKLWVRSGATTDISFYELRYSGKPAAFLRGFRALYLGVIYNLVVMATVLLGAVKIGVVLFGVPASTILIVTGVASLVYSCLSGIRGTIYTDFFIFVLVMAGACAVMYYSMQHPAVGGWSNLISNPQVTSRLSFFPDFSNREAFISIFLIPVAVQWWNVWYSGSEPGGGGYIVQRMLTAKSQKHAVGGTLFFNVLNYAIRPWPWYIAAFASILIFPDLNSIREAFPGVKPELVGDDMAYAAMIQFVPNGWVGLVAASMMGALFSTIAAQLSMGANYVTNDIWKRFVNKDANDRELILVARLASVFLMVAGCLLAPCLESAKAGFNLMVQIGAGTGIIFLLRWFWMRINAWTEIVAMAVSFLSAVFFELVWPHISDTPLLFWEKLLWTIAVTSIFWLIATFVTSPEKAEVIDKFKSLVRADGHDVGKGLLKMFLASIAIFAIMWGIGHALAGTQKNKSAMSSIDNRTIENIVASFEGSDPAMFEKGVRQCAALWQKEDGSADDFSAFVSRNFAGDAQEKKTLYNKLALAFEQMSGAYNQLVIDLQKPTVLDGPEPENIDYIFGAFSPSAHFLEDMFSNKVAFITVLNFPFYSLEEKNSLGKEWTRLEWAYARMGDIFTTRVPASVLQDAAVVTSATENYIASYNIEMGHLLTEDGERLFPQDMSLLSHWNLRDELKSDYADSKNGPAKQEMIYKVMERIVCQDIPRDIINNPGYDWAPFSNRTFKDGVELSLEPEGAERYQQILDTFHSMLELDRYNSQLSTGILRNFEGSMEVSSEDIEQLFIHLLSSPQVAQVAALIQKNLGRELRPYDIWYDGFKSRSSIPEDFLTEKTRRMYPNTQAFHSDMPRILGKLGFPHDYSLWLADKIEVETARGSGHAWGATGRGYHSFLRTRTGKKGMDYKGYNIAVHEFGHNVEQTIDLYDMDFQTMAGVPNTAFTEALAFVFQVRDLQLLGYEGGLDDNLTLDIFWSMYEIMGVSLVDMYLWRWLYEHPDAGAEQLRDNVLSIARKVWNKYYEPVLGAHDSPILAIYSHIVNTPMYLPNYPFGHIIEYQLEEYFASLPDPECIGPEIIRIFKLGRLTPHIWMQQAVGSAVSTDPILRAVDEILSKNL